MSTAARSYSSDRGVRKMGELVRDTESPRANEAIGGVTDDVGQSGSCYALINLNDVTDQAMAVGAAEQAARSCPHRSPTRPRSRGKTTTFSAASPFLLPIPPRIACTGERGRTVPERMNLPLNEASPRPDRRCSKYPRRSSNVEPGAASRADSSRAHTCGADLRGEQFHDPGAGRHRPNVSLISTSLALHFPPCALRGARHSRLGS